MEHEHHDGRRSSKTSWRSSSSIKSEEDSTSGISGNYLSEGIHPPGTAALRKLDINRRTDLTTGLKISDQSKNNIMLMNTMQEHALKQRNSIQISSARPLTSRGQGHRHIQNTRHFLGILHSKISQLNEEIERLHRLYKHAQQELNNCSAYEIKAKELAIEITKFQSILTDLNFAYESINSVGNIEQVELGAKQLAEMNDIEKKTLESLFCERKLKESFADQMRKKEISQRQILECPEMKEKYISFNNCLVQSSEAIQFWEKQIEQYNLMRDSINMEKTPLINEVITLEIKLLGLKRKLKEHIDSSSWKPEERRKLVDRVKQDKAEMSAMELSIRELNKKANGVKDVISKMETKKNDDTSSIEDNKLHNSENENEEALKNLRSLEEEIKNILGEIKNNLSFNPTSTDSINLETIGSEIQDVQAPLPDHFLNLHIFLKKMNLMDINIAEELKKLDSKCDKLKNNLKEYKTNTKLNMIIEIRENELINNKQQLIEDEKKNTKELESAKICLEELEQRLSTNEYHKEIIHLEEIHSDKEHEITVMKHMLDELTQFANDLKKIRSETLELIETVNINLMKVAGQE